MKRECYFYILLFFLLCCCSSKKVNPCQMPKRQGLKLKKIKSNIANTKTPALFILPGKVQQIERSRELFETMHQNSTVLFIHGRGDHPSKAVAHRLLDSLSQEYNTTPIMFTWVSGEGVWPEDKAREAAPDLSKVLHHLADYRKNANYPSQSTVNLLTHSMGSLVLEEFLSSYQANALPHKLFDNIVINASASKVDNHAKWVEKIDFAQNVYIAFNNNDPVLAAAGIGIGNARLGKHGDRQKGEAERLANNAIYIDFSDVLSEHRYYVGDGHHSCLYYFYNEVLNGRQPHLSNSRIFSANKTRSFSTNK